jgi:predicted TIM-barrel fold metal-dependent hydrolase
VSAQGYGTDGRPWIISVDDHVVEPPDLFEGRLPAKFADVGPRVVRLPWEAGEGYRQSFRPAASGPEVDFWQIEDIRFGLPKLEAAAGMAPEEITTEPTRYADIRPGCYRVAERLEDMDRIGVERSLCFPNLFRFAGQMFLWLSDHELGLACVRAYNDWMVEEWAGESGGRLIPLCMVPLWDPQLAAEEVRRNAARGVRAVSFSELPAKLGLPSIHARDGHWLPFIEACDETGTVICIHIGSSSTVASGSPDAPPSVRMTTVNFNAQLSFSDWMFSGLLARFPNLKLAFSESQLGWIPYVLERMDRIWRVGNAVARIDPAIVREPSSYMAGRVFACFFEDTFGIEVRDAVGVDQITFECDYPHQDSTWPNTETYLRTVLAGLSEDEVYKIARGNAIRMLDLAPDLRAPASAPAVS